MPQQTPLNKIHRQLGARMVDFAGWDMPVQYAGISEEHKAVRTKAGIFDVSHMGEVLVHGPKALELVQNVTCNDASRLQPGQSQYSALLTEEATFVDDIIVNCLAKDRFLICVNASNATKDFQWIQDFQTKDAQVEDQSEDYFLIALQGPESHQVAGSYCSTPLPDKPFTTMETAIGGYKVLAARTGYTGEDGYEFYGKPADAEAVWNFLLQHGATPCGLGARDTLRLEASLPLYGHEIDDTIHPYEAGLSWIVKLEKGNFIGSEKLKALREAPLQRKLVGLEMTEPGIARQGNRIFSGEKDIGWVTSGTKSPFLDRAIALGYVEKSFSEIGTKIKIDIHQKKRDAVVIPTPFYRRKK